MNQPTISQLAKLDATQSIDELYQIYIEYLESPDIYSYTTLLNHPVTQKLSTEQNTKGQFIYQLFTIFTTGTFTTLYNLLQSQSSSILPLLTPSMFYKLELLTLNTIIETKLLSTSHFLQLGTQTTFPQISLQSISDLLDHTHHRINLCTLLQSQTINTTLTIISPTPILSLLSKSISLQLITGILHDIGGDNSGQIEIRDIKPRDIALQSNNNDNNNTNSIELLINRLDGLIQAVDKTVVITDVQ